MSADPRRVLVTGASGFVGRQILAPLVRLGFETHAVSRRAQAGPSPEGVVWHRAELLDPVSVMRLLREIKPSHIIHTAWYVEHGRFWSAPENLDWVAATLSLARAAAEAGTRRFVGVGTCIEYDWSDGGPAPRKESDPLAPAFLYGEAKAACCRLLSASLPAMGVSFAWGRLFHLFGPGEDPKRLVASLFASFRLGQPVEIANGQLRRDFMASEDAGYALAALCASEATGPVNVASGTPVTIADLAQDAAAAVGCPQLLRVGHNPPRPGEARAMLADVTRLRAEIGVAPPPPAAERLRALWEEIEAQRRDTP